MRLFAFLFLAAFAIAGVMRYSKAAAPEPLAASVSRAVPAPLAATGATPAPMPLASLAASAPAPQVLRHKRRFAKAALRALKKAEAQQPAKPQKQMAQKQMARLHKAPRR
jgi:hypothetical protein